MPSGLTNFFRPTRGKLFLPLFFLSLPLSPLLSPLLYAPWLRWPVILLMSLPYLLCWPFSPLLNALGLAERTMGWFDLGGSTDGPTLPGVIMVMCIYAAISYLIACVIVYLKRKYPGSVLTKKW